MYLKDYKLLETSKHPEHQAKYLIYELESYPMTGLAPPIGILNLKTRGKGLDIFIL